MSYGRIFISLHKDVLRTGKVFPHGHHVLVLSFPVALCPRLLVKGILAGLHDFPGSLVCLGEPFLGAVLPLVFSESDNPDTSLLTDAGKTSGYCLIVLGHRACVKHSLSFECECSILVGRTFKGRIDRKKFGSLIEIGENLLPCFTLGCTRKVNLGLLSGIVNLGCHQRYASETACHLVEYICPYEIGLSEELVICNLRIISAICRKRCDKVVCISQEFECT